MSRKGQRQKITATEGGYLLKDIEGAIVSQQSRVLEIGYVEVVVDHATRRCALHSCYYTIW